MNQARLLSVLVFFAFMMGAASSSASSLSSSDDKVDAIVAYFDAAQVDIQQEIEVLAQQKEFEEKLTRAIPVLSGSAAITAQLFIWYQQHTYFNPAALQEMLEVALPVYYPKTLPLNYSIPSPNPYNITHAPLQAGLGQPSRLERSILWVTLDGYELHVSATYHKTSSGWVRNNWAYKYLTHTFSTENMSVLAQKLAGENGIPRYSPGLVPARTQIVNRIMNALRQIRVSPPAQFNAPELLKVNEWTGSFSWIRHVAQFRNAAAGLFVLGGAIFYAVSQADEKDELATLLTRLHRSCIEHDPGFELPNAQLRPGCVGQILNDVAQKQPKLIDALYSLTESRSGKGR